MQRAASGRLLNVEFKARCDDHERLRRVLAELGARRIGEDLQTDTYFRCLEGRLKLREGSIENALIFYRRADEAKARTSEVLLHPTSDGATLRQILTAALGVDVVVEKRREIFFVQNVKIHLDEVPQLGRFVEVEAIDPDGTARLTDLQAQCDRLQELFQIGPEMMESRSYSDLIRSIRSEDEPSSPRN